MADQHDAVAPQEKERLVGERGDRFIDLPEISQVDTDQGRAEESAVRAFKTPAEHEAGHAADPIGQRRTDENARAAAAHGILKIIAIEQIDRGRRKGARIVDDPALGVDERDDVDLRQTGQHVLQDAKHVPAAESGAKFLGRRGSGRGDPVLQLAQRQVDDTHGTCRLLGEHACDIARVALRVPHRVGVQAYDGERGRQYGQCDQRGRNGDEAAEFEMSPAIRHRGGIGSRFQPEG